MLLLLLVLLLVYYIILCYVMLYYNILYYIIIIIIIIYHHLFISTSASVKSYQLVKVVSGGRAPGKSSSLASPQLLVIEPISLFWGRAPGKSSIFVLRWSLKLIFDHSFKGTNAGCCLPAACLLLACLQDGTDTTDGADGAPTKPATLSARNGMKGFIPTGNRWMDRTTNFLRAVHDIDAHRANHRFGCGKQGAPISLSS